MNESVRGGLPIHPTPELPDQKSWAVTLADGAAEIALDADVFAALPHVDLVDDFTCLEGWSVESLAWRGVRLADLLAKLPSMASGPYLAASAPDTCAVIALSDLAAETILADGLNGAPLPRAHGGPYRLVVPGGVCFESVKWVQRLERCDTDERDTARSRAKRKPTVMDRSEAGRSASSIT
jgi:DMSO/TMAO reductase YedYZ molybdopterin-dependent catalytic subunit